MWLSLRIILSRNPLSGRNPGISPHRFEIPPPSAFRSCLSMLLETHVGDCSSICRAPAVCPTVSQVHRLAIIILHHHRYVLDTKSILRCGYNDCLATIMMPATTRALPSKDDRGAEGRPRGGGADILVRSTGNSVRKCVCRQEGHTRSTCPLIPHS